MDSGSSLKPNGQPKAKRRLSDASTDSQNAKKAKKSAPNSVPMTTNNSGDKSKDASNKTKSGRFKPGAPVDLDEQCGVMTDKEAPCARSLTCKTHGIGAKRAVAGRSKPFETLLKEFQIRKEERIKAEQQRLKDNPQLATKANGSSSGTKAAKAANTGGATKAGEAAGTSTAPKKKKSDGKAKGKSSAKNKADLILGEVDDPPEGDNVEEEAPDSDDEVDQLLDAMRNSKAAPLAEPTYPSFYRAPDKVARYRETFSMAFSGRKMSAVSS